MAFLLHQFLKEPGLQNKVIHDEVNITGKLLSKMFHLSSLSFKDPNSKHHQSNNMKKLFKTKSQRNIQSYCQQELKQSPKTREFQNYFVITFLKEAGVLLQ